MKVLGIYGSPRRQGNSDILMKAFLQGAAEAGAAVEEIFLRDLKISPCLEIYHCFKDGTCPIKDEMRGCMTNSSRRTWWPWVRRSSFTASAPRPRL